MVNYKVYFSKIGWKLVIMFRSDDFEESLIEMYYILLGKLVDRVLS